MTRLGRGIAGRMTGQEPKVPKQQRARNFLPSAGNQLAAQSATMPSGQGSDAPLAPEPTLSALALAKAELKRQHGD